MTRQGPGWHDGPQARWHDGDLPGVDSDKDTVLGDPVPEDAVPQLICSVCSLPHIGVAAAAKPAPEIDNRFEEAGGKASPGPATKHANTLHSTT